MITYHCDILRYKFLLQIYKPFLNRFLKRSKKIIVSSENLIHSSPILKNFKDKCVVIPFGINTDHLQLTELVKNKITEIKNKYKNNLILFVGRIVKYKGLDILIKAVKNTRANLLIVGQGPERSVLESLVQKSGLVDRVYFVGFVPQEELGAYYHACDIFALTSIDESEAFGLSLLDALACGKPLITSKLPTGISQINLDQKTGFQVPVGDSVMISEKINLLLSNSELREKFGQYGREHYKNTFSLENMINSHFKIYSEILGQNK